MTQLQRYDKDGLELIIDTITGEAFATVNGYSRLSGKAKSTIYKRLKGVHISNVKTAEIKTEGGVQGVRLIPSKLIFKWAIKDNPKLAEAMGECGATIYLHQLAGYKVISNAVNQPKIPQTFAEALQLAADQAKELEQLEQEKALLETENHQLSEAVDELFNYSSIIRVAKFNNCSEKAFSWRKLKAASLAMKLEIKRVPCPRYEYKCLYSHEVWRYVYPKYKLPETTTLVIKT